MLILSKIFPFEYSLSKKGKEQLEWVEGFAEELLLDLDT